MSLRSVAVLLQEPVALFEFGVLHEVFGIDRTEEGVPAFDYRVCAESSDPLDAQNGITVTAAFGLEAALDADLVAVPASPAARTPSPAVVEVLRAAVERVDLVRDPAAVGVVSRPGPGGTGPVLAPLAPVGPLHEVGHGGHEADDGGEGDDGLESAVRVHGTSLT